MLFYINLYTFLIGISKAAYTALFNLYLRSASYGNQVVGKATFYYSWGIAIGGLVFSSISDRIGRKTTLLLTMPLFSFFGFLRLYPMPVFWLYLFSFLFGFFDTSIIIPTISVIEGSDEKKKLRNSNINFAIVMLTGVIGYLGSGILSEKVGLKESLKISMLISVVSLLPLLKLPKVTVNLKKAAPVLNLVQLVILIYYFTSSALVSAAAGVFINFGNVIFLDLFAFSAPVITLILTISQLSTAITSVFSHKLTKKLGFKFSLFFFYLLVTILIFTMPAIMNKPAYFTLAYVLRYVLLNITTPTFTVFCLSYLPNSFLATFSGVSYLLNNIMRATSAQIFSHLSNDKTTNYSQLFFTTGIFYLTNTLLTLFTFIVVNVISQRNINLQISLALPKRKRRKVLIVSKINKPTKSSVHYHSHLVNRKR
ncbi:MAG: MFS transporter [Fervidobacterium sp.]|nr:MFS transporter [Fervidobacterium sp.]